MKVSYCEDRLREICTSPLKFITIKLNRPCDQKFHIQILLTADTKHITLHTNTHTQAHTHRDIWTHSHIVSSVLSSNLAVCDEIWQANMTT